MMKYNNPTRKKTIGEMMKADKPRKKDMAKVRSRKLKKKPARART